MQYYQDVKRWLIQLLFAVIVIFMLVLALAKPVFDGMQQLIFPNMFGQLEFIISLTLAGIFPISAIAYLLFQHGTRIRRLAKGFYLLGIDVRGDEKEEVIKKIEDANYRRQLPASSPATASSIPWDLQAYGQFFDETEDRSRVSWNYVVQSAFAVLATVVGLSLFFWFPREFWMEPDRYGVFGESKAIFQAMRYGFLGSYIFSIQLVYRRYTTYDLHPIFYMKCALTIVAGIIFNYVAFNALYALSGTEGFGETGLAGGVLPIVAFSLGYFPYLAIRWFNRVGYGALRMDEQRSNALPLGLIDGISRSHEARLQDEGIDNIQNLASAPLDELLMNTRFGAQEVAEWVDQAILYLYLDPVDIDPFRRGGIRSFSDLEDTWGPYFKAYHTIGEPSRKLLESFRHTRAGFSDLSSKRFQTLTGKLLADRNNDYQMYFGDVESPDPNNTPKPDPKERNVYFRNQLEKARSDFATRAEDDSRQP